MAGRGSNDSELPGDAWVNRITTVPVTDKQGCYNPQYPGAPVAVTFTEDDLQHNPHPNN
ncbi:MAG: hypothetical protein ACREQ5_00830 [Candidatus Dormibacteria bacterium]